MNAKPLVLVIDDDPNMTAWIRLVLKLSGFRALIASNAAQGVSLARRQRPDLIIMDILMPGMEGPLACSLMQDTDELKSIPVVITSSLPAMEAQARVRESGAVGFLPKPIRPESLLKCARLWSRRIPESA